MFIVLHVHGVLLEDAIFNSRFLKILGGVAQNGQLLLTATFLRDIV